MSEQRATVGRIVHYVIAEGEHRPAFVVRDWGNDTPNLQVFFDGDNDREHILSLAMSGIAPFRDNGSWVGWATSVKHDEESKKPGTWHWPERVQ